MVHFNAYSGLLGRPADIYDVAEHINIWWSAYVLACRIGAATDLIEGVSDISDQVRAPGLFVEPYLIQYVLCRSPPCFQYRSR